jgi:hypothetical protein
LITNMVDFISESVQLRIRQILMLHYMIKT